MKKYLKTLLLTISLLLLTVTPVSSQDDNERTFTIVPPTMQFRVKQGETLEAKVKVRNETDNPLTFTIFVRDFIVEDKLGTPKILPPDEASNRWSAAKWMTVLPESFTVSPRSSFESMLYVQIPGDATYGGHYAAIVFEPSSQSTVSGSGASIVTQSASLIYLHILGPITENGQITLFQAPKFSEYGPVKIETEIANFGDVHIKPIGTIEVKDIFGKTLKTLTLKEDNIFPGRAKTYENVWQKKWLAGKFTANLAATYGENGLPLTAIISFYVFPWKVALAIVLAIVIIILLSKFKKRNLSPPEFSKKAKNN